MLLDFLTWIGAYPLRYKIPAALFVAGLGLWILADHSRKQHRSKDNTHDWLWYGLILVTLVLGRWPSFFVTRNLNVDESQLIVGAHTLWHNPVFWQSVDGNTAGPLTFYLLWPLGVLDGFSFFSARITTLFLLWISAAATSATLSAHFGKTISRAAVYPTLVCLSLTEFGDFLHYSTELASICLISVATAIGLRPQPSPAALYWGAFLLGAAPWAKLQSGPLAFVTGLLICARVVHGRSPHMFWSVAGLTGVALLPTIVIGLLSWSAGVLSEGIHRYLFSNVLYLDRNETDIFEATRFIWNHTRFDLQVNVWLVMTGLLWLVLMYFGRSTFTERTRRGTLMGSFALVTAAVVAVLAPQRGFAHYLHFIFWPFSLFLGTLLATAWAERSQPEQRKLLLGLICLNLVGHVGLFLARPPRLARYLPYFHQQQKSAPAELVAQYVRPGEAIGLWGWVPGIYVESKTLQATRQAHSEAEIRPGAHQTQSRQTYLADLKRTNPPAFVDTTGPADWRWGSTSTYGHETFPELADWIQTHYVLTGRPDQVRVYVRKDRVTPISVAGQ